MNFEKYIIPESFETIQNILKTIKEYRDFSDPGSLAWAEYLQEFFHLIGFDTKILDSRLCLLSNLGGSGVPKAIVVYSYPDESFEEMIPGIAWEQFLRYVAHYNQIHWGILTNGLQLKVLNFREKMPFPNVWLDLDKTIKEEKLENFFLIYKVFSFLKHGEIGGISGVGKEPEGGSLDAAHNQSLPKPNFPSIGSKEFVQHILENRFGGDFHRVKNYVYMFESNSHLVYFQNYNKESKSLWFRILYRERDILISSQKEAWLCLTYPSKRMAYIFPIKNIEERAKAYDWKSQNFEIHIYPEKSWWQEFDWNIEPYRYVLAHNK